jgi:hypothetical protein
MFLQVFLRFLLGLVSRITVLTRPLRAIWEVAGQPYPTGVVSSRAVPHEWIRMANVRTGSSHAADCLLRGTFERPTHLLGSIYRFARRLAGAPNPCPALAATVYVVHRQSGRERP